MKRLWLIQAVGNALLFWCAFTWLGIRDSKTLQLVETALLGLVILVPWLWLQDGTMAFCSDRSQGLWGGFRRGAKTLAIFSAVVILFGLLFWALGKLEAPLMTAGERTASWLTFHLRKPFKPASWSRGYLALLWAVKWIVLPVVMLPVAAGAASEGVRGLKRGPSKVFCVQYLVALAVGYYLPGWLMHWVPNVESTGAQVMSFAVRFSIAYVLMVSTWLSLAFFSAARKG